jgi:hypothetical protein
MRRSLEMVLRVLMAALSLCVSDVIHNPLRAQEAAYNEANARGQNRFVFSVPVVANQLCSQ